MALRTELEGFLYPDPPIHHEGIMAIVVEKKGDETKTSMRQSEIYAYSNEIIIRSGYMVMPKIFWNDFEPGDWFICQREFSKDRDGNDKEERELKNLKKLKKSEYKKCEIPPTMVKNGNVMITRPFVLCPKFIRNRCVRNSYGNYTKVILMNIGQGFCHNRNQAIINSLKPSMVYVGIFEFHAKDNGAVNFGCRGEIRDSTNHVLERDAMWELVALVTEEKAVPVLEHHLMKEELKDLQKYAKLNEEMLVKKGYYDRGLISAAKRSDELVRHRPRSQLVAETESTDLSSPAAPRAANPIREITDRRQPPDTSESRTEVAELPVLSDDIPGDALPVIRTREELEEHRARVIMQAPFQAEGSRSPQQMWIDRETGQYARRRDLLDFKFNERHWPSESLPPAPPPMPSSSSSVQDPNWTLSSTIDHRMPLASSTPRTSPQMTRHRRPAGASARPRSGVDMNFNRTGAIDRTLNDTYRNSTSNTLAEMCRDNNANPSPARRL